MYDARVFLLIFNKHVDGAGDCHTEWISQKEKNKYHMLAHICGL